MLKYYTSVAVSAEIRRTETEMTCEATISKFTHFEKKFVMIFKRNRHGKVDAFGRDRRIYSIIQQRKRCRTVMVYSE